MLFSLAALLIVLWAVGLINSYVLGGYLHILLVVAVVLLIWRAVSGRRVIAP